MPSRGHDLEAAVNKCNLQYRLDKTAMIEKVELPVRLTKTAAIALRSTVDYKGIIPPRGQGIAFDAKETKSTTSFPLSNIHQHQIEYLKYWESVGGLAFFLIHFKEVFPNSAFIAPIPFVWGYYKNGVIEGTGRKSIPLEEFNEEWLTPIDNYLGTIISSIDSLL